MTFCFCIFIIIQFLSRYFFYEMTTFSPFYNPHQYSSQVFVLFCFALKIRPHFVTQAGLKLANSYTRSLPPWCTHGLYPMVSRKSDCSLEAELKPEKQVSLILSSLQQIPKEIYNPNITQKHTLGQTKLATKSCWDF